MGRREFKPRPPVNDDALEIGVKAARLRCDLGLWAHELADEHGWTTSAWLDAEQGHRGVADARQVLQWTVARIVAIERARLELLHELDLPALPHLEAA